MTLIIFIHIPKTAGTTLGRILRLHLAAWPPTRWIRHNRTLGYDNLGYSDTEDLERRFSRINALPPEHRRQVRYFAAHAGATLPARLELPSRTITILREPVARVISTWRYLRQLNAINSSLEDFALGHQQVHPYFVDNAQTRYLGVDSGRFIDAPPGACPAEALQRAIHRVDHELAFTALTERFDESALLLADSLNLRPLHYARTRVSRTHADPPSPATLDAIRQRNALDIALYQHAAARFDHLVRAAGPGFPDRLARFQSCNRLLAPVLSPILNTAPTLRHALQK